MSRIDYILFDLDGTLTDPAEGITNSVSYALEKFGIHIENKSDLNNFIGPPLAESFKKYYSFTPDEATRAVEYYREYFRDRGIFENLLYPGVPEMLRNLKNAGKTLILATSKPGIFAEQILKYFKIFDCFTFTAGSLLDNTRTNKAEVIEYALASLGIIDRNRAVMVGDREYDIIGAKETQISPVGVLWGYGSRAELEDAGAVFVAGDIPELENYLLR